MVVPVASQEPSLEPAPPSPEVVARETRDRPDREFPRPNPAGPGSGSLRPASDARSPPSPSSHASPAKPWRPEPPELPPPGPPPPGPPPALANAQLNELNMNRAVPWRKQRCQRLRDWRLIFSNTSMASCASASLSSLECYKPRSKTCCVTKSTEKKGSPSPALLSLCFAMLCLRITA